MNQDETTDLPLCINGEMVVFKMELVREPVFLGKREGASCKTACETGDKSQTILDAKRILSSDK